MHSVRNSSCYKGFSKMPFVFLGGSIYYTSKVHKATKTTIGGLLQQLVYYYKNSLQLNKLVLQLSAIQYNSVKHDLFQFLLQMAPILRSTSTFV